MRALPYEGFFTEPDHPVPDVVRVCPYCGEEAHERAYWGESLTTCRDHGIIEGQAICVPVDVYEIGVETTLAWITAHKGGTP